MEAHSFARSDGGLTVPRSRKLLGALSDERLIAQLRRGNDAAFEALYNRHHAGVLSYCRHMLGSRDEAEDALQQAFVSAHADIVSSDKPIRFKAWIYTIARNRCLSVLRSRREQPSDDIDGVSTAGLGEQVQHRADLKELLADLQELPDDQRDALVLSELGDLSHAQVAQVIDCEVAKVKSLVFQARSGLLERREARETPCHEIREQLATLRGGSLRRGPLRRHLKACPGCSEFREEVRRQRQAFAALLPVAPTIGLKESALAAVGIGTGSAAGGAALGGAGAIFTAKAGVAKVAVIAVATTGAVGGAVTVERKIAGDGGQGSSGRDAAGAPLAPHESPGPEGAPAPATADGPGRLAETVRMSVAKAGLGPAAGGGPRGSDIGQPGGDGRMNLPFGDDERRDEDDERLEPVKPESHDEQPSEDAPAEDEAHEHGGGGGDDGEEYAASEEMAAEEPSDDDAEPESRRQLPERSAADDDDLHHDDEFDSGDDDEEDEQEDDEESSSQPDCAFSSGLAAPSFSSSPSSKGNKDRRGGKSCDEDDDDLEDEDHDDEDVDD